MKSLTGKTIIITGGTRGIGAACVRLFVSEGGKVVIAARDKKDLTTIEQDIEKEYGKGCVQAIETDISKEADVKRLFKQTEESFGLVDILINNAAVVEVKDFIDYDLETWNHILGINLNGSFLCAKEAFLHMKKSNKGGVIINMSSLAGIQKTEKYKGGSSYVVSKFGIVGLTEILAVEGKEYGIRVNCVAPGAVDTEMRRQITPFLKTSTKPEDIARIVLFLCDEKQSKAINGSVLEIYSNEH